MAAPRAAVKTAASAASAAAAVLPFDAATRLTVVAIPFSHYNERARWALDLAGLPYTLVRTLPLLHFPVVAYYAWRFGAHTSASRTSTAYSTPLLCVSNGDGGHARALHDSGNIVAAAAAARPATHLFPPAWSAGDDALVERLHDDLGPAVRLHVYGAALLPDAAAFAELGARNGGPVHAAVWWATSPLLRAALRRALHVTPERTARAGARIEAAFRDVGAALAAKAAAAGVPAAAAYLGGDGTCFTAADLTFAALAAPAVGVSGDDGYGGWVTPLDRLPPDARAFVLRLRATPAGQHVLRCYAEHRRRRVAAA